LLPSIGGIGRVQFRQAPIPQPPQDLTGAEGAEALGLGPTQIILSVAYIVLILGLVIAFILVSLAA
jgi:hypothetical protein